MIIFHIDTPFSMFGIHDFGMFLAASIVLNLTPGADTFYILGRSIAQGRKAGVASALGIASGTVVHTFAAALGLSALVAASATAFFAIKLAGAAYLIYLGLRMLLAQPSALPLQPGCFSRPLKGQQAEGAAWGLFTQVYRQGLLVNILNPKVALFFLAFLPQFIATESANTLPAFLVLGASFVFTSLVWCFCLVWFSAALGKRLRGGKGASWLNRAAGTLFIYLGIRLAISK